MMKPTIEGEECCFSCIWRSMNEHRQFCVLMNASGEGEGVKECGSE